MKNRCHPFRKPNKKHLLQKSLEIDEDIKLKRFLEIEKSTFSCIKPFLVFSFMLNTAWFAALFVQNEIFLESLHSLATGALCSILFYFISLCAFLAAPFTRVNEYWKLIISRIIAYLSLIIGFLITIYSFDYSIDILFLLISKAKIIYEMNFPI